MAIKLNYDGKYFTSLERIDVEVNSIVDNNDHILVSGLGDYHGHVMHLGNVLLGLNLGDCKSITQCIELCRNYKNRRGEWLIGRGWNNENWGGEFPVRSDLDEIYPDTPVILERIDGHMAWVNSKALELAGINSTTKNPEGGEILRNDMGEANGLLVDNAMDIVKNIIPKPSKPELKEIIKHSISELKRSGIDIVCDMDVHFEWLDAFKEMAENDELGIDVISYLRGFDGQWEKLQAQAEKIGRLNLKGLKFYSDGALGSRGAALLEDYSDDPGNKGLILNSMELIYDVAQKAIPAGFEIAVHAIGDRANRIVLDLFEKLRSEFPKAELRIEHAQIVHPDDWKRFKELNVKSYIQPMFEISDASMADKRLGERVNYAYPWKQLLENGAELFGSSDFPIESHDPLTGLNALIDHGLDKKEAIEIYRY